MAVFVLVHGSWGGGWQWQPVAEMLRAAGHSVYTPTLTGCGDRHRGTTDPAAVTLARHIDDVTDLLFFDDLTDVVLVGWSYGAHVVAGVADASPDCVSALINLDGGLATEGSSQLDDIDESGRAALRDELAAGEATGWVPAPTADDLSDVLFDPQLRVWVGERERPHPYATWTSPFPDHGGARNLIRSTYLRCRAPDGTADIPVADPGHTSQRKTTQTSPRCAPTRTGPWPTCRSTTSASSTPRASWRTR